MHNVNELLYNSIDKCFLIWVTNADNEYLEELIDKCNFVRQVAPLKNLAIGVGIACYNITHPLTKAKLKPKG